jgi:hypothetical protein
MGAKRSRTRDPASGRLLTVRYRVPFCGSCLSAHDLITVITTWHQRPRKPALTLLVKTVKQFRNRPNVVSIIRIKSARSAAARPVHSHGKRRAVRTPMMAVRKQERFLYASFHSSSLSKNASRMPTACWHGSQRSGAGSTTLPDQIALLAWLSWRCNQEGLQQQSRS